MVPKHCRFPLASLLIASSAFTTHAQTPKPAPNSPTFGHSMQGEAFDAGPRRRTGLLPGRANIQFPVTSRHKDVRPLVEQGIGLIHAYAYYEAERSFREAADLDPQCAIAFWGMALANTNNQSRGRSFLEKAVGLKSKASEREQWHIDALAARWSKDGSDDQRRNNSLAILEKLVAKYPFDLEAKALLGHERMQLHYRQPGRGNPDQRIAAIRAAREVDQVFQEILSVDPEHPVHHYRIHLWDFDIARQYALDSAAYCGLSEPGIAHMWHMCGHTYAGLRRYTDAAWYQEASSRTDHALQLHARLLPDQIHNYAHNQQWLVESLVYTGRAADACAVARNLVEIPRHPSYNRLGGGGSAEMGRMRLLMALQTFELWPEAVDSLRRGAFDDGGNTRLKTERLRLAAIASAETGDLAAAKIHRAELESLTRKEDGGPADVDSHAVAAGLSEIDTRMALRSSDNAAARAELDRGKIHDPLLRARLELRAGRSENAHRFSKAAHESSPNQVAPLATHVEALIAVGDLAAARKAFSQLRTVAGSAGLDTPVLRRITALAPGFGAPGDWRTPAPLPADAGPRPALDSLGPLLWSPPKSPKGNVTTEKGRKVSLTAVEGDSKANLVVFYLGAACQRCRKQLEAFTPLHAQFQQLGINLLAVSTDERQVLGEAKLPDGKPYPFPLLADPDGKAFRSFGAWDDFENMALHGVYLIDKQGKLLWWDHGARPFEDAKFLLEEAKRLLAKQP